MGGSGMDGFLVKSGFASVVETDGEGLITASSLPALRRGEPLSSFLPGLRMDTTCVQEVSGNLNGASRVFRAAVRVERDRRTILLQDVSEHASVARTLRNAVSLQSKVMKAIPDIVILKDREGNWLGCNAAAEEIRQSGASGEPDAPVLSPVCPESDREAWNSDRFIRRDEKLPDGRIFDVTKTAMWHDDGTPHCLLVIARDVTASRLREERISGLNLLVATLRTIDRLLFESDTAEDLISGAVSALIKSGLFSTCLAGLLEGAYMDIPPEAMEHLEGLDWKGGTLLLQETPGIPGDGLIAARLTGGEGCFGYVLGRPSAEAETLLEVSFEEILADVAGDLGFALRSMQLRDEQIRYSEDVLKTRNMLDAFLENFPGPAFIRDSSSRYLKINEKLRELSRDADWIERDPGDIYPEEVARNLLSRDAKVLRDGYLCLVRDFFDQDGGEINLETHYFRIDQENNDPLIGGVAMDITERLRTEEALQRSEERYRAIYDNTGTAMAILDTEGRIVSANANIERLSGYLPEEVVGKAYWHQFVHEDDLAGVAEKRRQRLQGDPHASMEYEFRLKRKDGSFSHVHACTGTIPNTGGMGVLSLSDITGLVESRADLNRSLQKTRSLLKAIPDLMFVLNRDGVFRDFHANDDSMLALSAEAIPGGTIADTGLSPGDLSRVKAALAATIDTGTVNSVEYSLELAEGLRHFEACMSPFEEDSALVLCRDITGRKVAEEEQKRLESQIRHSQKLESLGILAGGIAHDFNNILMAISGNVFLAREALGSGSSPLEYLEAVEKAANRASDLAGKMLAYSGRGESRISPVDLNAIALDVSELLKASMSKKIQLEFNLDRDMPMIMADATQVRQVVMNLITNASEALEQNPGKVTVTTGSMECGREYLDTLNRTEKLKPGPYSWIQVDDTGKGMESDLFDRIFDPFFTTKFTGRGLGLSAVLGIMSSHGGAMRIDSKPGEGSSFRALFPAAEVLDTGESSGDPRSVEGFSGSGTVLFVDDEPLIRSVAETMISTMGLSVLTASDGLEGFRVFMSNKEDIGLVILDLTMPGMDGDEVFREIRKVSPETPVLISSGYNENEMLVRFSGFKPDGFLKKPYSVAELSGKIGDLLSSRPF